MSRYNEGFIQPIIEPTSPLGWKRSSQIFENYQARLAHGLITLTVYARYETSVVDEQRIIGYGYTIQGADKRITQPGPYDLEEAQVTACLHVYQLLSSEIDHLNQIVCGQKEQESK